MGEAQVTSAGADRHSKRDLALCAAVLTHGQGRGGSDPRCGHRRGFESGR